MFKKTSTGGGMAATCTPGGMLSSCGCLADQGLLQSKIPGTTGRKFPFPNTNPLNTLSRPAWQQQTPKDKGALKKKKK